MPTSSMLLPRTLPSPSPAPESPPHILLLTSPTGHLSALTSLPEPSHRRLLSLSTQLFSALPALAGLNTKSYRIPGTANQGSVGVDSAAGRSAAVVDGAVLARWAELGSAKKTEVGTRSGYEGVEETRSELRNVLGWSGLSYF